MDPEFEKTEKPTAKKLKDARTQGSFAISPALSAALLFMAFLAILALAGNWLFALVKSTFYDYFQQLECNPDLGVAPFLSPLLPLILLLGLLLILIFFLSFVANAFQTKFFFSFQGSKKRKKKKKDRDFFYQFFYTIVKWGVAAVVGYWMIRQLPYQSVPLFAPADTKVHWLFKRSIWVAFLLALPMLLLAVGDYLYQKQKHYKSLYMTKEEVKEELKEANLKNKQ